jgi:predicted NAD/FAD-binding protein
VWDAVYRNYLFILNFSKLRSTLNRHSQLPSARLCLSTPLHAAWSGEGNVILETATGKRETFDHIIFACHSGDARHILDAGSGVMPAELENLSAFRWNRNEV